MTTIYTMQGQFVSNGRTKVLRLQSDPTWIEAVNVTRLAQSSSTNFKFEWMQGMPQNSCIRYSRGGNPTYQRYDGFSRIGYPRPIRGSLKEVSRLGTAKSFASITSTNNSEKATIAAASGVNFNEFQRGDVVRIGSVTSSTKSTSFSWAGLDYIVADITVSSGNVSALGIAAPYGTSTTAATTAGTLFKVVTRDADYTEPVRDILHVENASGFVRLRLNTYHSYFKGATVKVKLPPVYGLTLNSTDGDEFTAVVTARSTNIDATNPVNTITLDYPWSNLTGTFVYPKMSDEPFTRARISSVGRLANLDTINDLRSARTSDYYVGIELAAGGSSGAPSAPAGFNNDVIAWRAGTANNYLNDPQEPYNIT